MMESTQTLSKIQSELAAGENVVFIHEAVLLGGWVKTSRILAVVENVSSYGLFVFDVIHRTNDNSDVNIDYAFPINNEFNIIVDADENCLDISVTVTFHKVKLTFEMITNKKTKQFISELHNIAENANKTEQSLDFGWLSRYEKETTSESMKKIVSQEERQSAAMNSELLVPRQSIARGTTPIAGRESVVRYQMTLKENDYTYTQPIRIFVGTWNVNGQAPTVPLCDWLNSDTEPPDIYAIGFQELDLSKEAYIFNDSSKEDEWLQAVRVGLKQKDVRYNKLSLVRLVGMMLIVFVKEQHYAYIRNVATNTVGTGIMNRMGNKGGVAIRFEIHSTSICFVNAHFAAHVDEVERRNQDYRDICSRISFSIFLPNKTIKDHDQIYWFGDLNYRIELDAVNVKSLIEKQNYGEILNYDQLKQNHREGKIFEKYEEGKITFRPTYKYNTGSDEWDSSEKNRAPAWCDRVLWKGEQISQIAYRSHPLLKISDHKPVSTIFISKIRVIDAIKYRKIHEEVMKKLDKLENEFLPHVMVDTTDVVFGNVCFLESQCKSLTIANTGQVPVQFEFIKKLDDNSYCKDWLHIEPYMGFIMPGEKCDVQLEIYVDKRSACELNSGKDKLYDILVLHLEGGKDIFITVTGTYVYSCFGMPLHVLSRIKVPIREIPKEELLKFYDRSDYGQNEAYPVPKEIWYLVDHLYRNGMKQHHLFGQPGLHSELLKIRDWLDTGVPEHIPSDVLFN